MPIPALYSVSTGTPHLTPSSVDHILSVLSTNGGLKAWWNLPAEAFVSPDLADSAEGKDGWRKGTDTMDVWFDSGSAWSLITPRESGSTVEKPLADAVLEGSDQHRGWFQSLLLTYLSASSQDATTKPRAPYKTVVTHGMVLDDEKRKMSKSEGNILAPEGVMDGSAFKDGVAEEKGVGKKKKGVQKVRCLSSQPRPFAARALLTSCLTLLHLLRLDALRSRHPSGLGSLERLHERLVHRSASHRRGLQQPVHRPQDPAFPHRLGRAEHEGHH